MKKTNTEFALKLTWKDKNPMRIDDPIEMI